MCSTCFSCFFYKKYSGGLCTLCNCLETQVITYNAIPTYPHGSPPSCDLYGGVCLRKSLKTSHHLWTMPCPREFRGLPCRVTPEHSNRWMLRRKGSSLWAPTGPERNRSLHASTVRPFGSMTLNCLHDQPPSEVAFCAASLALLPPISVLIAIPGDLEVPID